MRALKDPLTMVMNRLQRFPGSTVRLGGSFESRSGLVFRANVCCTPSDRDQIRRTYMLLHNGKLGIAGTGTLVRVASKSFLGNGFAHCGRGRKKWM